MSPFGVNKPQWLTHDGSTHYGMEAHQFYGIDVVNIPVVRLTRLA